jgi:hypothetical protein
VLTFAFGGLLVLHGLVHLLYAGQGWRFFALQPGLAWPDGSWAFSRLLGDEATRTLAGIACVLAAAGFLAGGSGVLAGQEWWRPVVVGAAALSAGAFALFWDGRVRQLDDQGGIGLLLDAATLVAVLVARWPEVDV